MSIREAASSSHLPASPSMSLETSDFGLHLRHFTLSIFCSCSDILLWSNPKSTFVSASAVSTYSYCIMDIIHAVHTIKTFFFLQVPNYYKIINKPMDFSCIKCKMSRNHFNHYSSVEAFLDDCKLVFRNCAVYNSVSSLGTLLIKKRRKVQSFRLKYEKKRLQCLEYVWIMVTESIACLQRGASLFLIFCSVVLAAALYILLFQCFSSAANWFLAPPNPPPPPTFFKIKIK